MFDDVGDTLAKPNISNAFQSPTTRAFVTVDV